MRPLNLTTVLIVLSLFASSARAIDFYCTPDTSRGNIGDTVLVSGRIGTSEMLRGFTVYLTYDTNDFDLASAPVAGTLVAARRSLDFRYSDHITAQPSLLEVGATVFSTDYWAGPGELFRAKFVLRRCRGVVVTGDATFRSSGGNYIPGNYDSPVVIICSMGPQTPASVTNLVASARTDSVTLHWSAARLDVSGVPLQWYPMYTVFRQRILPNGGIQESVGTTMDTLYATPMESADEYLYWITATVP